MGRNVSCYLLLAFCHINIMEACTNLKLGVSWSCCQCHMLWSGFLFHRAIYVPVLNTSWPQAKPTTRTRKTVALFLLSPEYPVHPPLYRAPHRTPLFNFSTSPHVHNELFYAVITLVVYCAIAICNDY